VLHAEAAAPRVRPRTSLVLLGTSESARRLDQEIRAAAGASCVLVEGEAGLDLVDIARAIHGLSRRAGSCVVLDCGAAEPTQVERELFGDLPRRSAGEIESIGAHCALARAQAGTLYLGDLSELSAAAQARLARVARDGEVRIGGGDACRLDVMLVAALSSDLESEMQEGRLRHDLLRHFNRMRLAVPPLRRRAEDIPLMIDALVTELCGEADMARKTLTQSAITLLSAMPWHGNLDELRHALARIVCASAGDHIQLEDVLAHVRFDGALAPKAPAGTLRSARQQFERDYIALVLQHHRGRVGDAARALGIQRTNLYRKARQLGISVARSHNGTTS
jgi:two-component system, NtrC family, nitrogen regulation response regulator NtrX